MTSDQPFLTPRFENIPSALKELPWAVWIAEPRKGKPGKFDKAPRCPIKGCKIGANKPELFGTFDQAHAAHSQGRYTGVGILLIGNGIVGIDIDDVRKVFAEQPQVRSWVRSALQRGAYCETSPSDTGLRLFVHGAPLPETVKRKHGGLEIYDNLRFLTVTGHIIGKR